MKRIFIGIPARANVQAKADDFHYQHPDLPARWVKPENLHITLVPPWEADDISAVSSKLQAVSCEPFGVIFDRISLGPDPNQSRLIWARGKADKIINNLRLTIYRALGQFPDSRPFHLHLTLARLSPPFQEPAPYLIRGGVPRAKREVGWLINWLMPVDRFVLYESHLRPEGAEYEILAEFRF